MVIPSSLLHNRIIITSSTVTPIESVNIPSSHTQYHPMAVIKVPREGKGKAV